MASFSLDFGASSQNLGAGNNYPLHFFAHFPPEAGCIGLSAVDGTLTIFAKVTNIARQYLARAISDGTSLKVTEFAVGSGGYNVSFPLMALPVDPTDTSLSAELFRDTVDLVETPLSSGIPKAYVCRLAKDDVAGGIGEIALFAEILNSPYLSEVGTKFPFVIVHQPLSGKTLQHVQTFRVVVVF